MKKQFIFAAAFFAATTMFVSCEDVDDPVGNEEESTVLSGSISEDYTLKANTTYTLDGAYVVNEGATLTIEEGVEIVAIDDDTDDYILVVQGAKINAQGTASNPIVMTSERKEAGAWGGVHICGYASTNVGTGVSEIGNAPYGGSDDADNSGTLKYIRLEYTGYALNEEQESNGVSFYGVGNGTTVEYLQAYRGADDGFEFFGGTVNVKYLVATSCADDSFDWTEGWRGKAQFLVAYHEEESDLGYTCDCLFEADNNGDDNSASPMSRPTIANVTLVGNGSTTKNDGVMLKAGTQIELHNAIITRKTNPITTKTAVTESALSSGASKLENILMDGDLYSNEGTYTNDDFLSVSTNSNTYVFALSNNYIGTESSTSGSTPSDSFFTAADYKGAVPEGNDWTSGWVRNSDDVIETTLSGTYTNDVTLSANHSYTLSGALVIEAGATLTIEEGVTLTAVNDDLDDYILIKQGAKIDAQGTATNPIVMTSEKQEAGAWGGIHICGYATTNLGTTGVSEIGNAPYGGSDDSDNSGILRYIRLEYTGFAFDEETESNGVTFYGVGNGTTVEYLQAYRGADDGFEFFGGTVNVKYLVATSCGDDSFDWTEGWRGKAQFLVAYHEDESELGYECDCLFEADNNGDDNNASPMSRPTIANVTLVGNNSTTKKDGVMLKAGTQIELHNAIVTRKVNPITTKTDVTENALLSGESILENVLMDGALYSNQSIYTNDDFLTVLSNSNDYIFGLSNNYVGTVSSEDGTTPSDSFFTVADYKGAVAEGNDWTSGWVRNSDDVITSVDSYEYPSDEILEGRFYSNVTLKANETYTLSGALVFKEGAALYIEEGVNLIAKDDDLDDYILIEQGAQIFAQGTATNPIIMTSEREEAGAWGGIHICGYATTNIGSLGVSEIGNAPYGGDDDSDNSGVLRYIRLEYTGFAFNEETESNGVTFYGVGNGTTVEYLQAYRGADDGFEFFGGTVNVKYLIATSCSDDSFDWTEGWRGKGQFLIAYHEEGDVLGYDCDCLLEADNNGDDNNASPMSHPVLSNLTLVGNNSTTKKDGVMLKAGTQVELYNTIITGKTYPIYTKTSVTEDALVSGASILDYITMTGEVYAAVGAYSNDAFIASENNSTDYVNELTNNYYGTVAGGSTPSDSFFTSADYKGAISTDNDWAAGWSL